MADDYLAIADVVADALDLTDIEVTNVLNDAPFFAALPAVTSSNGTAHKYARRTQAPVVAFRAENVGRSIDHSIDEVITVTLKILDFSWEVDKAVADACRRGREWLIAREGKAHLGAALSIAEKQCIYGTGTGGDAGGHAGFFDNAGMDALADTMVYDCGGSTATTGSSIYLVRTGEADCCGVVNGDGVLDLGETTVQDFCTADAHLPVYYTPACLWLGLQIASTYSVARIANNTADAAGLLTDDKIYEALSLFPASRQPNVIVMNRRSLKQLRQSRTATNATGVPAPRPTDVDGIPIIVTDSIIETEAIET